MACFLKDGWEKKILPIVNEAGLDIDYEWQIGQAQWWLDNKAD